MVHISDMAPRSNQAIIPYDDRLVSKYDSPSTNIRVVTDNDFPIGPCAEVDIFPESDVIFEAHFPAFGNIHTSFQKQAAAELNPFNAQAASSYKKAAYRYRRTTKTNEFMSQIFKLFQRFNSSRNKRR
jgi:hypothetical protein